MRESSKKRLLASDSRENKDINPTFHLVFQYRPPPPPLTSKTQLPIPIAHHKFEGATDV